MKLPRDHPKHKPLKVGTLNRVLNEVAQHLGMDSKNYCGDCPLRGPAFSSNR
jgi:hypothetical protein